MKVSYNWLKQWINTDSSAEDIAAGLTRLGLEVDSVTSAGATFTNVTIGEVLSAEQHPDADRLRVCQVNIGAEAPLNIVCGAANVRAGLKVAVAVIGAVLPGNFKIKKSKLRGVTSEGMICSEEELGLEQKAAGGIMELAADAPIGESFSDYLQLDDEIIDVDLTPNRGDCLSMYGIAREAAIALDSEFTDLEIESIQAASEKTIEITVSESKACPRYIGRVIEGVDATVATPVWLSESIRRAGVRPINIVVDIANYVMLELGQPLHAFDLAKLSGGIDVRFAKSGEKLTLLDGQMVELRTDSLVIVDAAGPVAIAGVMGGLDSSVTDTTTAVLLESAYFAPDVIMGRPRQYGLHTDAGQRFERGVDFELQQVATERFTELLLELAGGQAGPVIEVVSAADLPQRYPIKLRRERLAALLGQVIPEEEITSSLSKLGAKLKSIDEGWEVLPPSHRFDLAIEEDLVEEVARIYGYDNLPSELPKLSGTAGAVQESELNQLAIMDSLVARGYSQAITYSFVDAKTEKLLNPSHEPIALSNPLSPELAVMRSTLWSSLLQALRYNLNRQQHRVRLFEIGLSFQQAAGVTQQLPKLAAVVTGDVLPEQWGADAVKTDFYDVKADVEALFQLSGHSQHLCFTRSEHDALHPGQQAAIVLAGEQVGLIGMLHPRLASALDLGEASIWLYELDLVALKRAQVPEFAILSKFPAIRRDIAVLVEQTVTAEQLIDQIRAQGGDMLTNVEIFDVYQGEHIPTGEKSVAIGLTLQHASRTLKDKDVTSVMEQVTSSLEDKFNARLRN